MIGQFILSAFLNFFVNRFLQSTGGSTVASTVQLGAPHVSHDVKGHIANDVHVAGAVYGHRLCEW